MTFASEVVLGNRGRALRFDFSLDDFSTVTYRLSDVEGKLDGTNWYTPRVVSCGAFRRALGQSRIAASGGFELVIANHDGAYDALCNRATINDTAKLRVRAYVVLYDVTAPTSFTSRRLGEYVCDRWPTRNNDVIRLQLADDILGPLSQGVTLPTFLDWSSVGTSATNPLANGAGYPEAYNVYSPVQLAFGEDWVLAFPHLIPRSPHANYSDEVIVPVCCTTDTTTAASDSEISDVRVQLYADEAGGVGPVLEVNDSYTYSSNTIWRVERSPTITKDGKSFKVIYLCVNIRAFYAFIYTFHRGYLDVKTTADAAGNSTGAFVQPWFAFLGGYPPETVENAGGSAGAAYEYQGALARVQNWYVKGKPLSARTQTTLAQQHACDVIKDIVTEYTKSTLACDSTSLAAVKSARAGARVAGVIQPWTEDREGGRKVVRTGPVRPVLTALCQSSDLDIFMNWAGDVAFSSDAYVYTLAEQTQLNYLESTIPVLEEARLLSIEEWVASNGERGAPYNRLRMEGGKSSPADGLPVPFQGPWDFDSSINCGIDIASRIVEATLQQGWRPFEQQRQPPWWWRVLEAECRPRIRFRYPIDALRLDLGDYFYLPWARSLGSPYSEPTLWQVESMAYAPQDDTVEIEAAWRHSLVGQKGYLLDDMTKAVRVNSGGGRTATVTDSSTTVTFSSGSLIADGVAAGDVLVLKDSTLADDVYTRFRALLVASVTDATNLVISSADLDFDTAGGTAVSTWTIYRGATTYHTAVSDPTNYPSGGAMYGKVTDASGQFSDTAEGNLLLDG